VGKVGKMRVKNGTDSFPVKGFTQDKARDKVGHEHLAR
jgi:hypothetical protein